MVVLVALATAVLASRITTLVVEVDPDAQLPQEHPYIAALGRLNELDFSQVNPFDAQAQVGKTAFLDPMRGRCLFGSIN